VQIELVIYAQHKALHCTAVRESDLGDQGPCTTSDHEVAVAIKQRDMFSGSRATATVA